MNDGEDGCFGGERIKSRGMNYLGLLSFGIFILIIGAIFIANPNILTDFFQWVEQMVDQEQFIRPPDGVIFGAFVFFTLIGISNFFTAAVRLWIKDSTRKAISDTLSGVALVFFAYLIHLYSQYTIEWQIVLGIEIIIVGMLVVVYSLIHYWLTK